jgi:NitT/TauT family transport system ATP-binding protein
VAGEVMAAAQGAGVEVRGVSKSFGVDGAQVTVLDDVSLTIGMGEFVSVIGPSGCGKSTLLKVVAGLLDADSGTVTIDGESVTAASRDKKIGLVPQSPALLPWKTVRENVELPVRINAKANTGRALRDPAELLATFGLGQAMTKYPGQLSGGMQQRAAIARAFVFDPAIMLMDEPFSALDEFTRESLQDQLLDLWDELRTTVLFVTHSVSEAVRMSDTVVVMAPRPGRIVDVIDIDLPRPRNQRLFEEQRFHEYEDLVRTRLHSAWRTADAA